MMMMRALALAGLVATVGCSDPAAKPYLVVSVTAPVAVHGVDRLTVRVTIDGVSLSNDLAFTGHAFPATFAVDLNGHTGPLLLEVEAYDRDRVLVGRGSASPDAAATTGVVALDTVDFVVNSEVANDQRLSVYEGEHGFQLAASSTGVWTVAYREQCQMPCAIQARRFDATGVPVDSQVAAGPMAFAASVVPTTSYSTPAVASSDDTELVVWNAQSTGLSVACRAFDASGAAKSSEVTVAADTGPNIVSVTKLGSSNFAVVWDSGQGGSNIRSAIVKPDCSTLTAPIAVNTVVGAVVKSSAASGSDRILYAWLLDGNVRVRVLSNTNSPITADTQLVAKTATDEVIQARVAALGGNQFAVFTRWQSITDNAAPGRIEMLRTTATGTVMGAPVVVTTKSGSDFYSSQAFGVAPRGDGSVLVVWHSCDANGDGNACGVFGRLVSASGGLVGTELTIPTNTIGDQTGPSAAALPGGAFVIAWSDASGAEPDHSGTAVRARIIDPSSPARTRPAPTGAPLATVTLPD